MSIEDSWLTQEEAAQKLHIALDTMRRYVREGRFPRTKVGKRYLIPGFAIEEFLQKGLLTGPRPSAPRKTKPPVELSGEELLQKGLLAGPRKVTLRKKREPERHQATIRAKKPEDWKGLTAGNMRLKKPPPFPAS